MVDDPSSGRHSGSRHDDRRGRHVGDRLGVLHIVDLDDSAGVERVAQGAEAGVDL